MKRTNPSESVVVLAATLGGSPRPVAVSLLAHRPVRAVFFTSPGTAGGLTQRHDPAQPPSFQNQPGVFELCERGGLTPPPHRVVQVDHQNLAQCVTAMRAALRDELARAGGDAPTLVLDITGGTKLMSAALAMAGQRLACRISYVGAAEGGNPAAARDKGGFGVTLDGHESVVLRPNPWDALGHQAIEDALLLFNAGDPAGAEALLARHRDAVSDPLVRRRLTAWAHLAEGYAAWERFDHKAACHALRLAADPKALALLAEALTPACAAVLASALARDVAWLERLAGAQAATSDLARDLLAGAFRRAAAGRFEGAVLCAYRAVEALAQARLREAHGLDTRAVPGHVPSDAYYDAWNLRRPGPGKALELNLQKSYGLLADLGDPLGEQFMELALQKSKSPLNERNHSILAHGFQPVGSRVWKQLSYKALKLAGWTEADLPAFPELE